MRRSPTARALDRAGREQRIPHGLELWSLRRARARAVTRLGRGYDRHSIDLPRGAGATCHGEDTGHRIAPVGPTARRFKALGGPGLAARIERVSTRDSDTYATAPAAIGMGVDEPSRQ
jgi:hypothetical protein